MKNNIKEEVNKIAIPKSLSERSKQGITRAKREMPPKRKLQRTKLITWIAASLLFVIGGAILLNNQQAEDNDHAITETEESSLQFQLAPVVNEIFYKNQYYNLRITFDNVTDAEVRELIKHTDESIGMLVKGNERDTPFILSEDAYARAEDPEEVIIIGDALFSQHKLTKEKSIFILFNTAGTEGDLLGVYKPK